MKLIDFFAGVCRFSADCSDSERLLNLLLRSKLVYRDFSVSEGRTVLFCSERTSVRLAALCREAGIEVEYIPVYGLPALRGEIRRRWGLIVGAAAALILMILGESVIWDVRVTGCGDVLTVTEAEEIFASYGVYPGVFRRSIEVDRIAAEAVAASDKLAWAAVNIRGTTAVIEVREQLDPPKAPQAEPEGGFDGENLVASCDGLVTELEVIAGKPVVVRGQSVKKGELLVSGVIDSTRIGFRITRAQGEVRAETAHFIEVEIPYEYEKKLPDGRESLEIWLIFFSKEVKIFGKGGIWGDNCDTIRSRDLLMLPGGKVVPVGLGRIRSVGYTYAPATRSTEAAARLAEFELSRRLSDILSEGAYPVRKTVTREAGEDAYRISCELTCVRNIAVSQGFFFETPEDSGENNGDSADGR